jgi:hypothetical protein
MAMTGPYTEGTEANLIRAGGRAVDVYIGRFDESLTRVEKWVRASENDLPDFCPGVWVKPSATN